MSARAKWFASALVIVAAIACCVVAFTSWRTSVPADRIEAVYDPDTGRLRQLRYDSDGNGKVDTLSDMDGTRLLRLEIDENEDGRIERWEYFDSNRRLEKIGFSRFDDGIEDAWSYLGSDGQVARVEISTRRDGRVSRTEFYRGSLPVNAEEDSDGDGAIDKWETYQDGRLAFVSFDSKHVGKPDRRLAYLADGSTKVEVDVTGAGRWSQERAGK